MTLSPSRTASWHTNNWIVCAIITILALIIYHAAFSADYFFLDESFELWKRTSNENYTVFASSGRLLTGIIFQKFISSIDTVAELKLLRMTSLFGWIATSLLLYQFSKTWVRKFELDARLPFVLALLCICGSAATINIGWASCFTFFLGFIVALCSSQILFKVLTNEDKDSNPGFLVLFSIVALGVASLLIYQNMFGVFLLPFMLWWISPNQKDNKNKVYIAVAIYLVIFIIYFLLFKYYVKRLHIPVTDRAELVFNPISKFSFFFSTPFSQAWSLNHLINAHNIISQIFPFALFVTWIIFFHRHLGKKIGATIVGVIVVIGFLFLSYLPSIAASVNYSPYRTMAALNICAGALFAGTVLTNLNLDKFKLAFTGCLLLFSVFFAYTNFNMRFTDPLKKEYSNAVSQSFWKEYNAKDTVIFIRPSSTIFKEMYGITSYKDEFGVPGTLRDWVPDPWTRQLIYEHSSMEVANKAVILQFRDQKHYIDSLGNSIFKPLIIDMNKIIRGN